MIKKTSSKVRTADEATKNRISKLGLRLHTSSEMAICAITNWTKISQNRYFSSTEQDVADDAGPPSALLVRQEGEMCSIVTFDMEAADQELFDLLKFREHLIEQNKDVARKHRGCLSYSIAALGMQELKRQWRERPDTRAKEHEVWCREAMDYDVVSRTLQSNFRTWLYVTHKH